jgi:hypothetical protein
MAEQTTAATADTSTAAAATGTDATTATDKGVTTTTAAAAATTDKGTTAATTATAATADTTTADTKTTQPDWPEDWQQRIAGDDKDELKQLSRYASPKAVWEKARALERRMSSGELKAVLPKNPTEADLTAWRKDNGIPEKPEAYTLKLASGDKITKELQPAVDAILKNAHATNMTGEQASAAVDSYLAVKKQEAQVRAETDETQRTQALDALAKEWGGSLSRNKSLIGNVLNMFPEAVRNSMMDARLPDGSLIFNNVDVLRAFAAIELRNNPAGIITPAGGGDVGKTALDEYQAIQKLMREKPHEYKKDAAKQGRMTELIGFLSTQGLIDNNGNVVQKKAA